MKRNFSSKSSLIQKENDKTELNNELEFVNTILENAYVGTQVKIRWWNWMTYKEIYSEIDKGKIQLINEKSTNMEELEEM